MARIVDIMMRELGKRTKAQMGIGLELSEDARGLIIEKGYDQKYGARPLRRTIQSQIEDQLAEQVLEGSVKAGDTVAIEAEGDAFRFTVKTKESQPVS